MAKTSTDPVVADLVMIGANLQIARLFPSGSSNQVECLELLGRLLPKIPPGRRTDEWRVACQYFKKHQPTSTDLSCAD